jgi:hypothetical protein
MTRLTRLALAAAPCALAAVIGVAAAAAAGPSPGVLAGRDGVRAPGAAMRYVALTGQGTTALGAIRVRDGRVLRFRTLRGELGVPLVAFDGTAGGLSHDGRTLVLSTYAPPDGTSSTTQFAVIRTRGLGVARRIELPGTWAFDALSPNGRTIYALSYPSANDPNLYEVRAIDTASGRVLPGAIVDKREPDEAMRGLPVTRAVDAEGRWVYTLYAKSDGSGFVHALDTVARRAVCIDLPWHGVGEALWKVEMRAGKGSLSLRQGGVGRLAVVDLTRFAVRSLRSPVR